MGNANNSGESLPENVCRVTIEYKGQKQSLEIADPDINLKVHDGRGVDASGTMYLYWATGYDLHISGKNPREKQDEAEVYARDAECHRRNEEAKRRRQNENS
jgi:hypothetical protein